MGTGRDSRGGVIIVGGFEFGWWDHADFAVRTTVVEPVDVGERCRFDGAGVLPESASVDQLGLAEAVE